jgi:hypothetical protein
VIGERSRRFALPAFVLLQRRFAHFGEQFPRRGNFEKELREATEMSVASGLKSVFVSNLCGFASLIDVAKGGDGAKFASREIFVFDLLLSLASKAV